MYKVNDLWDSGARVCLCVCVWKHEAYTDFDKSEAPAEDEAPIESRSHASSSSLIRYYFGKNTLYGGEWRETNKFLIPFELCHELDIWCLSI